MFMPPYTTQAPLLHTFQHKLFLHCATEYVQKALIIARAEKLRLYPHLSHLFHKHKVAQLICLIPNTGFQRVPNEQDSTQNLTLGSILLPAPGPVFAIEDSSCTTAT